MPVEEEGLILKNFPEAPESGGAASAIQEEGLKRVEINHIVNSQRDVGAISGENGGGTKMEDSQSRIRD